MTASDLKTGIETTPKCRVYKMYLIQRSMTSVGKGKVVPVLNCAPHHEGVLGVEV
jgi:hypothetical protein